MKVVKTTINDGETSVELDLFEGRRLPAKVKRRIQDEVGEFLVEQTLIHMNEKKSPVQGAPNYPALSKMYRKKKLEEVGSSQANLEFDGIMKDELGFERSENGIDLGVFGERAGAADGHNNLSGRSQLPLRKFLPDEGESYRRNIAREVERIVVDIIAEEATFRKSEFRDISTKSELYAKLKEIFGDMSRAELQTAAFRNEDLVDILAELNLVGLL